LTTFDIIEEKNMGGSILHLLMKDIINNFDKAKQEDTRVLNWVCFLERILLKVVRFPAMKIFLYARKNKRIFFTIKLVMQFF